MPTHRNLCETFLDAVHRFMDGDLVDYGPLEHHAAVCPHCRSLLRFAGFLRRYQTEVPTPPLNRDFTDRIVARAIGDAQRKRLVGPRRAVGLLAIQLVFFASAGALLMWSSRIDHSGGSSIKPTAPRRVEPESEAPYQIPFTEPGQTIVSFLRRSAADLKSVITEETQGSEQETEPHLAKDVPQLQRPWSRWRNGMLSGLDPMSRSTRRAVALITSEVLPQP